MKSLSSIACALAASACAGFAQTPSFTAKDRQPSPEELAKLPAVVLEKTAALLAEVKAPEEFTVTIFATPPAVNYPVFVAAAPDGTLFVSSDGNGSLDRKPHLGRVLRVRDTDGDGQADEVKAFVPDVDSPRGLVWDHDRLYLLHPPDVSVFIDHNGDGVADEKRTLIQGIGWTFKGRPADHASNGLSLGIDGWLYAAIGDFGFMEAAGTDGRKLQMRGGGVVRFRPDGTGLERFADGTRNILEVAMSPLLDGFARDNTNDGGGWDVRFHHFSGFTDHGYPRLFKNFADEIIPPLADYGGGSGCGAAWVDEPGIPARWNNAPFTADWGRERVYHHGVAPKGATFTATQEEFLRLPRVTDLDVDGNSAIYAASWKGASFTWVGPEVGYIVKLTPKNHRPEPMPDFAKAGDEELVKLLESPSHRRRLEAQRTLIRRELAAAERKSASPLSVLAADGRKPLASRIAALFAMKQTLGANANAILAIMAADTSIRPWVLRALADDPDQKSGVAPEILQSALASDDPRARREAVIALGRIGDPARSGRAIVPLLASEDVVVAHTAVQALISLRAVEPCLAVVDSDAAAELRAGALRVLQSLHETEVVDALAARLEKETSASRRTGLITALCRLHSVEGRWKGDSWGTRPDTRGPYYQPESWSGTSKAATALHSALDRADAAEAAFIGREMARHRIPAGGALDKLIARATSEPSLLPAIATQLSEAEEIPPNAIPLLLRAAASDNTGDAARAQAVIALSKTATLEAWRAILSALPRVQQTKTENNLAEKARAAVNNSARLDQVHSLFEEVAPQLNGAPALLAESLLLKLASRKIGSPEARAAASRSLDEGWAQPKRRLQILHAAAQAGDASRAAQFITALDDADPEVASAARETIRRLRIHPEKFRAAASTAKVGDLSADAAITEAARLKGEPVRGEQLFTQLGCVGCHTVKAEEPLKGPFLGNIATIYKRRELAEAILLPNKTLAQGFVANHFELNDGTEIDGFVVREAADAVTIRTITAQEQTIPVSRIARREKLQKSLMPDGLASGLTIQEFSSLLDYLQSLSAVK